MAGQHERHTRNPENPELRPLVEAAGLGMLSATLFLLPSLLGMAGVFGLLVSPLPVYWAGRREWLMGLVAATVATAAIAPLAPPFVSLFMYFGLYLLPAVAAAAFADRNLLRAPLTGTGIGRAVAGIVTAVGLVAAVGISGYDASKHQPGAASAAFRSNIAEAMKAVGTAARMPVDTRTRIDSMAEGLKALPVGLLELQIVQGPALWQVANGAAFLALAERAGIAGPSPVSRMVLPRTLGLGLGAAVLAAAFMGDARAAPIAIVGALLTAYLLQGFAIVHAVTQNYPGRGILLTGVYVMAVFTPFVQPILILLGLSDRMANWRDRLKQQN